AVGPDAGVPHFGGAGGMGDGERDPHAGVEAAAGDDVAAKRAHRVGRGADGRVDRRAASLAALGGEGGPDGQRRDRDGEGRYQQEDAKPGQHLSGLLDPPPPGAPRGWEPRPTAGVARRRATARTNKIARYTKP